MRQMIQEYWGRHAWGEEQWKKFAINCYNQNLPQFMLLKASLEMYKFAHAIITFIDLIRLSNTDLGWVLWASSSFYNWKKIKIIKAGIISLFWSRKEKEITMSTCSPEEQRQSLLEPRNIYGLPVSTCKTASNFLLVWANSFLVQYRAWEQLKYHNMETTINL